MHEDKIRWYLEEAQRLLWMAHRQIAPDHAALSDPQDRQLEQRIFVASEATAHAIEYIVSGDDRE